MARCECEPFERAAGFQFAVAGGGPHRDELLGIAADDNAWAARRDDVLAAAAQSTQAVDEVILDPGRVEGVLRLIDDHRRVAVRKQDDQDGRTALAVGQVLDRRVGAVVRFIEFHRQDVWQLNQLQVKKLPPQIPLVDVCVQSSHAGRIRDHKTKLMITEISQLIMTFITGGTYAAEDLVNAMIRTAPITADENLAKQRGLYVDYLDGAVHKPTDVTAKQARKAVAMLREAIEASPQLTERFASRFEYISEHLCDLLSWRTMRSNIDVWQFSH